MRISREKMFMEIAHVVAQRATCQRLNVGAIIVRNNRIVSIGYNGTESGAAHCAGEACEGWHAGCHITIHAEDNALRYLPEGMTSNNLELYCTDSPCKACWEMLKQDGRVGRVYFRTPYRINEHLLEECHIEVFRVLPSGTVIDWRNNKMVKQ